ncbi:MAG: DUF4167 domain-containing protein [Pararhizobium sp.]
MRPGQQNKRGRGRNNNNGNNNGRKGGNPLSRTYDSSGPDVKIRGTAQHIAEKYSALARDAQSSGDNVMAENYLQHAEHYNRIVAAAQAQMQERYQRDDRDSDRDGFGDRDGFSDRDEHESGRPHAEQAHQHRSGGYPNGGGNGHDRSAERERHDDEHAEEASPEDHPTHINGSGPQPVIEGTPAELAIEEGQAASPRRATPGRRRATARPRRQRKSEGDDQTGGSAESSAAGDAGEAHVAVTSD